MNATVLYAGQADELYLEDVIFNIGELYTCISHVVYKCMIVEQEFELRRGMSKNELMSIEASTTDDKLHIGHLRTVHKTSI